MKPKFITTENYLQFKPSEFIRSFASDVDVAMEITKKTGKRMNMNSFNNGDHCLPCLGGMACMNLAGTTSVYEGVAEYTKDLGDRIRLASKYGIHIYLRKIYPSLKEIELPYDMEVFTGIMLDKDLVVLKEQIHKIADAYEASGQ